MISEKENTRISKLLSLVLRHRPETIGIELDENGWTDVDTLMHKMNGHGISINLDILKFVVDTNSKKRFAFNDTFDKLRANQGHSIEVELGYQPMQPPAVLYHGTGERSVSQIRLTGLQKMERHHVHLSADIGTAMKVGQRHGKPVVFEILAGMMYNDKFEFYRADNGVWLTDHVPVSFIRQLDDDR